MQLKNTFFALAVVFFAATTTAAPLSDTRRHKGGPDVDFHNPSERKDQDPDRFQTPGFNPNGGGDGPKPPTDLMKCKGDVRTCMDMYNPDKGRPGKKHSGPADKRPKFHNPHRPGADMLPYQANYEMAKHIFEKSKAKLTPEQVKELEDLIKKVDAEKDDKKKAPLMKDFFKRMKKAWKEAGKKRPEGKPEEQKPEEQKPPTPPVPGTPSPTTAPIPAPEKVPKGKPEEQEPLNPPVPGTPSPAPAPAEGGKDKP